jgi:hypothetical protein
MGPICSAQVALDGRAASAWGEEDEQGKRPPTQKNLKK